MKPQPAVLAVGDLLRDVHVLSRVTRLNPDSPNIVIEAGDRSERAGGVGIGCSTLVNLDARVTLASAWSAEDQDIVQTNPYCTQINIVPGSPVPHKVRYVAGHTVLARIDDNGPNQPRTSAVPPGGIEDFVMACHRAESVLVSDYGLDLTLAVPDVYQAIADAALAGTVVWDFHPRSEVIAPPGALLKFNQTDFLQLAARRTNVAAGDLRTAASQLLRSHGWRAIVITEGPDGALLVTPDRIEQFPTYPLQIGSAVGAGDILSALWARLAVDFGIAESAARAVRVASMALAVREDALDDLPGDVEHEDLAMATRAVGGTLVVTAGCFDLLHAGHVDLLREARKQGDALVVLINSDSSVSRIKGRERPFLSEDDRIAVLRELRCVTAVGIFDEDTPESRLVDLCPDVYVKGGDYALHDLPEAAVLTRNGTEVRIIPRIRPVSTTSIATRFYK